MTVMLSSDGKNAVAIRAWSVCRVDRWTEKRTSHGTAFSLAIHSHYESYRLELDVGWEEADAVRTIILNGLPALPPLAKREAGIFWLVFLIGLVLGATLSPAWFR